MSRSNRGEKPAGSDWWNRRPLAGYQAGAKSRSKNKQICNQIERAQERELILEEIKNLDDLTELPETEYYSLGYYLGRQWQIILGGAGA